MLRDYVVLNRTFVAREAYCTRTKSKGGLALQADECGWHRLDCLRFRAHPSFRLPNDPPMSPDGSVQAFPVENGNEFSLLRFMQTVTMSAMLGLSIPLTKGRPPGKSRSPRASCEADCPRRKERDLSKYQSSLTGEDHLRLTTTKGLPPRNLSLSYRTGRVLSEARSWVALRWMEASLRKPSLRVLSSRTEFYPV
ncbi:hypothetical protein LB505_004620 [Fusarium chuoi]|nr:hypothetical protein LB505_004620 [Fusarium chuoi]